MENLFSALRSIEYANPITLEVLLAYGFSFTRRESEVDRVDFIKIYVERFVRTCGKIIRISNESNINHFFI